MKVTEVTFPAADDTQGIEVQSLLQNEKTNYALEESTCESRHT